MKDFVRLLPIVSACVMTQACAVGPAPNSGAPDKLASQRVAAPGSPLASSPINATSSTTAPTATSPGQSTEVNTAAPLPKVHRIVLEDKTLTNAEVKELFARGFKPIGRNGEVYYCRQEPDIGSRFTSMSCNTADQLKLLMQDSKNLLHDKQRPGACGSMHGLGGC
jgi:hypothetical protein